VAPLLKSQLGGAGDPQVDLRTNAVFYRVAQSQKENIALFLETIDRPTRQVMIEARLVEVTANPKQSYGINWAGVVGGSASPQTIRYGGSLVTTKTETNTVSPIDGGITGPASGATTTTITNALGLGDFFRRGEGPNILGAVAGQIAILSAPQMSLTLRLLNEDQDAEFLANPRVVTADNQEAKIQITRNQPVPQLNFNEQTATAVFGGFEDKTFGNTLIVKPTINKDDFITMSVKPEISNKVGDATFTFAGATVASPVIDTRTLDSNVLIKSGDTLAVGGLLQDEVGKSRSKVPVLGDIPVLGYMFQERMNTRVKRNLLVFVTPVIIKEGYNTGLEDQVSGLHHSGEEFADPNGWRNNARGAIRFVPTSNRPDAADYPKPGSPLPPERVAVSYKVSAAGRGK
jgi:general secretion pathway protein D